MDVERHILTERASLRDVMQLLNAGVFGIALIVDTDGRLVGIFTDGDVRRALLAGASPEAPAAGHMNRHFVSAAASTDRHEALALLSENRRHLPLLDEAGRPVAVLSWAQLWRLGVSAPHLGGNEMKYVDDCLANGWISSQGQYVGLFEKALAGYLGVGHAVSTSSGTTALHLALTALGIGAGDEVIVPSVTFAACASTVVQCGARPVFVEVDPDTWTLDPQRTAEAVTPRTRAIMPVHLYGHPCDMDPLLEIARRHDLLVVEDCAEAMGARYRGRPVGGFGHVGCFSFFANKNMTTGEGGMLVTDDDRLADRLRTLRSHGMTSLTWDRHKGHAWSYDVVDLGYNYRIDEIRSALGPHLRCADHLLRSLERYRSKNHERLALELVLIERCQQLPVEVGVRVPEGTE